MSDNIQKTHWEPKPCDICGEEKRLTLLGTRTYRQPTQSDLFEFAHEDALCETCGFVFSGKIPDSEFLNTYYREAYTLQSDIKVIPPDFDPRPRLSVIREFLPVGSSIFEIGAATGEFVRILNIEAYKATGIDPLAKSSDVVEEQALSSPGFEPDERFDRFDAAMGFFVLEHITEPRPWLLAVKPYLKPDGILITEVPDFSRHPVESLFPEHLLHFTPFHLRILLESCGYEVLKTVDEQSRSFGFIMVARLSNDEAGTEFSIDSIPEEQRLRQVQESRLTYQDAVARMETETRRLQALAKHLKEAVVETGSKGADIYIWPANPIARSIADKLDDNLTVFALDSSKTKIGSIYPGFREPVRSPLLDAKNPRHRIFLLTSPSWNREIEKQLMNMKLEDISVVDAMKWQPSAID